MPAQASRRGGTARLHLLRDFDPERGNGDVPDPYYGGPDGFENVYALVRRAAEAFLDRLEAERRQGKGEQASLDGEQGQRDAGGP